MSVPKARIIIPQDISHMATPVIEGLDSVRRLALEYINSHGLLEGIRQFMSDYPQLAKDLLNLYKETHLIEPQNRRFRALIGSHTDEEWHNKKVEYKHKCVYCNIESKRLTKDHIIPIFYGGSNTIDNIVPACRSCNSKKHTRLLSELEGIFPSKII